MDNDSVVSVQFGRGRMTIRAVNTKREMTWTITSQHTSDEILDVMQDVLVELRATKVTDWQHFAQSQMTDPFYSEDDVKAQQPPVGAPIGGSIDL